MRVDFVTDSRNHGRSALGNGLGTYLPGLEDEDGSSTTNGDDPGVTGVEVVDDPFEADGAGWAVEGVELEEDGMGGGSISEIRRGTEEAGARWEMGVPRLVIGWLYVGSRDGAATNVNGSSPAGASAMGEKGQSLDRQPASDAEREKERAAYR